MTGVQSSLYTIAMAVGLFSVAVLSGRRGRETAVPQGYLGLYLGLVSLGLGLEWAMVSGVTPFKALWLALRMAASLWIGPLLWLSVRQLTEGRRPDWRQLPAGHFIAVGVGMVLTLPLMATAHGGLGFENPEGNVSAVHSRFIHGAMLGCIGIFAVQVPFYLMRCYRLLRASGVPLSGGWLPVLCLVVVSTWVLGLLRTLHCIMIGEDLGFGLMFALVDVAVTMGTFYVLVRHFAVAAVAPAPEAVAVETRPKPKYQKSQIPDGTRDRIRDKLERALGDEAVVSDCELSLRALSEFLGEPPHHVSQVINQCYDISFYALLNRHRVEAAKRVLRSHPDQTVLEIALGVGFNSKSTFNATFRKVVGMTPREYRASELR